MRNIEQISVSVAVGQNDNVIVRIGAVDDHGCAYLLDGVPGSSRAKWMKLPPIAEQEEK